MRLIYYILAFSAITTPMLWHIVSAKELGDSHKGTFDVVSFEVCDPALYKKSYGKEVVNIYVPWREILLLMAFWTFTVIAIVFLIG